MLSGKKSLMSMVLALLLLCGAALAEESTSGATALTNADYQQIVSTYSIDASIPGYADYLQRYEDAAYPDVTVTVDADTFVRYEDAGIAAQPQVFEDYEGMAGKSVLTGEESLTEWVVDVPESGLYDLTLLYYPYAGKNSAIQRAFFVDGKLPYSELAMVDFNRVWVNGAYEEYTDENGIVVRKWDKDNQGNDLKPSPIEQPEWCTHGLYDTNGYISDEMSIYLEAGQHTLTLLSMREPMLLRSITLSNHSRPAAYVDVKAAGDAAGHQDATGVSVRFEAETPSRHLLRCFTPCRISPARLCTPCRRGICSITPSAAAGRTRASGLSGHLKCRRTVTTKSRWWTSRTSSAASTCTAKS